MRACPLFRLLEATPARGAVSYTHLYNAPGLPEIEGHFDGCDILGDSISDWRGAFIRDGLLYGNIVGSPSGMGIELPTTFSAMASNPIYGSSATVMPASINLPVILYLGILA